MKVFKFNFRSIFWKNWLIVVFISLFSLFVEFSLLFLIFYFSIIFKIESLTIIFSILIVFLVFEYFFYKKCISFTDRVSVILSKKLK